MGVINWSVVSEWWNGDAGISRRWLVVAVVSAAMIGAAIAWHWAAH